MERMMRNAKKLWQGRSLLHLVVVSLTFLLAVVTAEAQQTTSL
jgi:hypothetical protein